MPTATTTAMTPSTIVSGWASQSGCRRNSGVLPIATRRSRRSNWSSLLGRATASIAAAFETSADLSLGASCTAIDPPSTVHCIGRLPDCCPCALVCSMVSS